MTDEFKKFELAGWEASAEAYSLSLTALTNQAIPALLNAAQVREGCRFLDIAAGPGHLANAASKMGAIVTGLDFSPQMLTVARRNYPEIEFVEGDAESLTLPSDSFDAVTMSFGLLHLSHPQKAMSEVFRVLKPGGYFAFSIWAPPEKAVGFKFILDAVQKFGATGITLPEGPPFFKYSDESTAFQDLKKAGFTNCSSETISTFWRFETAAELFATFYNGTARTGALLRAQPKANLAAIEQAVSDSLLGFTGKQREFEIEMPVMIYWALK